ncbi:DNA repair protein RecO [Kordiimonas sp.]|uniref:DNA repair protein RecO n=1 Tax=Kordiimonas sp. TaxID=1970157 RepID=UPI003A8ECF72
MEWQDEGIVLSVSRHGEADAVLEVMTRDHGRARGFIKGGLGRRNKANLQVGNRLSLKWYARLEANLGRFTVELIHSPLGQMMGEGSRISALSAITAVVASTLPEREAHVSVFEALEALIALLEHDGGSPPQWGGALARMEMGILSELGYGLDLSQCAGTGVRENLVYVSPKTGRAVSLEAGGPYKEKLLPLAPFLTSGKLSDATAEEAASGLALTGYFLERTVWAVAGTGQPPARDRFLSTLRRLSR